MRIRAKNPSPGRVPSSAIALLFVCLIPALLFAQGPSAEMREAATAGDTQAQFALGNYYFNIRFETLDYLQVLTWYRKSAAQGFAPAQNQLASMYENNIGLPQDDKNAANYYRLAANQGYAPAQNNLAAMFENGRGVHRDYIQALGWYRKAADQNLSSAEKQVGVKMQVDSEHLEADRF
ncbi:MAG TPA: tetratricopeptide repeat protein [Terracidiphilus sp.]|nr:tetratricopeptide repeat protein [Terracidiphilus sp.]